MWQVRPRLALHHVQQVLGLDSRQPPGHGAWGVLPGQPTCPLDCREGLTVPVERGGPVADPRAIALEQIVGRPVSQDVVDRLPKRWPVVKSPNHRVITETFDIRWCGKCEQWKSTQDFYQRTGDGTYMSYCKPCQNEYQAELHQR